MFVVQYVKVFLFLWFSCTQAELRFKDSFCPSPALVAKLSFYIVNESEEQNYHHPVVVASILYQETRIRNVPGLDKEIGYMQVRWTGQAIYKQNSKTPNLWDAEENIREGVARIKYWKKHSRDGNYIARYNCGWNLKSKLCSKRRHGMDYQRQVYQRISMFKRFFGIGGNT